MVKLKSLLEYLPEYLKFKNKNDIENTEKMTIKYLGNSFRIMVARDSAEDADKVGRGLTTPILGFDELAYLKNIHITLPVAISSTNAARKEAAKSNALNGIFYVTTAGKLHIKSGKYAHELYKSGTRWSYRYFDSKDIEDLVTKAKLNAGSAKGRISPSFSMTFSHRQLGISDEEFKEMIAMSNASELDIETDYLNKW